MDPGLGTSERMALHRAQSAMIPPQRRVDDEFAGAVAAITCRSCRARIPVDEIDAHECSPVKAAAGRSFPPKWKAVEAAGSLLDALQAAEPSQASSSTDGTVQTRQAEAPLADFLPSVDSVVARPPHLSSIDRSLSMPASPVTTSLFGAVDSTPSVSTASASNLLAAFSPRARGASDADSASASPIQCRVRGVRVTKSRVAVYSIISSLPKTPPPPPPALLPFNGPGADATTSSASTATASASGGVSVTSASNEIVVERRYREFYAFALNVHSMFPSRELWQRLPPKTYCALLAPSRRLSDGFLLRRKNGLDDFVRGAVEMMALGSAAQGSLAQWYLVRLFLGLSPAALPCPTKDRSLSAAMAELQQLMSDPSGWRAVGRVEEHDAVFDKVADGFPVVKRVRQCHFPARAVFDMIVRRADSSNSPARRGHRSSDGLDAGRSSLGLAASGLAEAEADNAAAMTWDPNVESREVLRRVDGNTWVERTVYKGRWMSGSLQTVSLKTWRVEESGAIVVAMIPADERDWDDLPRAGSSSAGASTAAYSGGQRVDCILGGWLLTPTPGEETCTVTWLVQANFGACTPQDEFTGTHGLQAVVARRVLLSWAGEVSSLLAALEATYDPAHYRRLGPLLSTGAFHKLQLGRPEATASALEDPRVYAVASELEPRLCLLLHKSSNRNALVFKVNLSASSKSDVDAQTPLQAEWIMFEKSGNPRQELSAVERNTTYRFSTRRMAPNVHRLSLELLRRDCVLRYDPQRGYALFTTVNGRPNTLLRRVFLSYAKNSRMGFARLEEVTLVGDTESEVVAVG